VYIADRLRRFREAKNLSQGDIEKRSGLLRCYISRVENGATVPSIETLEKITRALQIPLYQLFFQAEEAPAIKPISLPDGIPDWTLSRAGRSYLARLTHALSQMSESDRALLLHTAGGLARRGRRNGA
jgi:transcriptional regulator with XRE-family HTH domain